MTAPARPDPYADGLAVVIDLPSPATRGDVARCEAALAAWKRAYETAGDPSLRQCGTIAVEGSRRFVLWADRVRDPQGSEVARERAAGVAREFVAHWPGSMSHIESACEALGEAELRDFLGLPAHEVSKARLEAIWLGAWREQARSGLLEPGLSWIGALCIVRLALSELVGSPRLASVATLLWLPVLIWASRDRTRPIVMAGALVPIVSSIAILSVRVLSLTLEQSIMLVRTEISALLIWGVGWALYKR